MIRYLNLNSWGGLSSYRIEVIGETPKRFRIQAITKTKVAGRQRWLKPGDTTLVPKHAITTEPLGEVVNFGISD